MENVAKSKIRKRKVKQGSNVRIARTCKNMTQEELAFRMNMSQSKISALEVQDEIDEDILDEIAKELDVPVDFLKNFELDEAIKLFTFNNSEAINAMAAENSTNAVVQGQGEQENIIYNYNYPHDKIAELYDRLLKEKDKQIDRFEKQIESIQKQLEDLKTHLIK